MKWLVIFIVVLMVGFSSSCQSVEGDTLTRLNTSRDSVYCSSWIDTLTNTRVYLAVDSMPAVAGGYEVLLGEIRKIRYPHHPGAESLYLAFVVTADGSVAAKRNLLAGNYNSEFSSEMLEVISRVKWIPGKCHGEPVDVLLIFPIRIHFR